MKRLRWRHAAVPFLLLTGGLALAGVAPIAPGERPAPGSTEAELWYAMDRAERELRQMPLVLEDAALTRYLRGQLCAVAGPHCDDLRLYVLEVPEFNASMAPNGATLLFTGALLRLRDESELAFLLGHEFAHYRQRHSLQQWESAKRSTAALGAFSLVTFGAGVGLAGSVAQLAGYAGMAGFSREHEREADRIGLAAAAASGFDPAAGARLWARLAEEERATAGRRHNPVFASHPRTAERLEDTRRLAEAQSAPPPDPVEAAARRQRYLAAIGPHLDRLLRGELSRRRFATSVVVIGGLHADAPPEWRGHTAFYLGEAYRQRRQPGDAERAAALYAEAVASPAPPPAAFREHGFALREAGDHAGAAAALRRYLALSPEAPDRAFVERDLKRLTP